MQTAAEIQRCLKKTKHAVLTSSELSTGLPRPLPTPQPHSMTAHVMADPMSIASRLVISGNVVTLYKK